MKNKILKEQSVSQQSIENVSLGFSDYFALAFVIGLLYVDFLPAFRSIDILGTQFFYMAILNLIVCVYLFFNLDKFSIGLIGSLKKSWFIKCFYTFIFLAGLSFVGTNNFSLYIVNFSHVVIVGLTIFNLIILFNGKKYLFYHIAFFFSISLFVQCFSGLYSLFSKFQLSELGANIYTLKGNTGNINIFAASINVKIPFLIMGMLHLSTWKQWFCGVALFLGATVVLLLGSRASLLGLISEIIFVVFYLLYKTDNMKKSVILISMILLPVILSFITVNVLSSANKSVVRNSGIVDNIKTISNTGTDSSITSRFKYWENGSKIIANNPFFGVGMGNWRIESLAYETKDFNDLLISEHSHNDFIEIAAECGILASLSYAAMFLLLFILNIRNILYNDDKEIKFFSLIAMLIFIGYLFDCFFNFPLHRPTMQISFSFLLVITFVNSYLSANVQQYRFSKAILIFTTIVTLCVGYFTYCAFEAYRLENDITADIQSPQDLMTADQIKDRLPDYPNVFTNSEPFVELLGVYLVKEKKYAEAQKYLNKAYKINPYNGRVEWYKHRIANENNKKDSAYIYAKQAFKARPRNYDYFISLLSMANEFKDTIEMLKTHKIYHGYVKKAKNWIDTSNGLHNASYNKKNILDFITQGVKEYPTDKLLLERQKVFEYELNANKLSPNFKIDDTKPQTPAELYIYLVQKAINYGSQNNFAKSLECYNKILKIDPNNITVVQNIGICYFKINQFQKAINELEKTIGEPTLNDGKTEFILGVSYINIQKKSQGCNYLKIAASKNFKEANAVLQQQCK